MSLIAAHELPVEAIHAFRVRFAHRDVIINFNDVLDDTLDAMVPQAHSPTTVTYNVVGAFRASVTLGLHGVSPDRTYRCRAIARPHVDGIRSVSEVVYANAR